MANICTTRPPTTICQRWRIHITGTVQGVGFRPFVACVARDLKLTGWVCNDATGVLIEIQGDCLTTFVDIVTKSPPPLACIEQVNIVEISTVAPPTNSQSSSFQIFPSQKGHNQTKISPDTAICQHCLQELFDEQSHFYHYPFISCSDCGPRYTLTTALPYDRHQTSMAKFPLCAACLQDYQQPDNRRYSTESMACHDCGPVYSMPVAEMAAAIANGEILAIKGLGGYQLICDAKQSATIEQLRQRKHRPEKPFALMVLNMASAANVVTVDKLAAELLTSAIRPIVLLPKELTSISELVAPGLADLGVMLPSTALHYLLFFYLLGAPTGSDWLEKPCSAVLIVTSGNESGEPLISDDDIAAEKLNLIADHVVSHSRDIVTHIDDSVMMLAKNGPLLVRRARGFVPEPILLDCEIPFILGLGGDLKNTFCITRGREAFVSQHIGNLNNVTSRRCYQDTLAHMLTMLNIKPEYIAHDCHPDFYTSQIAAQFAVPTYAVQHHHAHLAAVAAEYHLKKPALGLTLDGFGLGENQQNWGGELFFYKGATARRIASLRPLPQPGGDQVARQPWRMAVSALYSMGLKKEINQRFSHLTQCQQLVALLDHCVHYPTYCPLTSSCGRLFDAVSALLGICWHSSYEGQAAMKLEALVTQPEVLTDGWVIQNNQLDLLPTLHYLLDCDPVTGANIFHGTLAAALTELVVRHAGIYQLTYVLLGGGCFLNRILVNLLTAHLTTAGLVPLLSKQLPPDDAGLCLGQAWAGVQNIMSDKI